MSVIEQVIPMRSVNYLSPQSAMAQIIYCIVFMYFSGFQIIYDIDSRRHAQELLSPAYNLMISIGMFFPCFLSFSMKKMPAEIEAILLERSNKM